MTLSPSQIKLGAELLVQFKREAKRHGEPDNNPPLRADLLGHRKLRPAEHSDKLPVHFDRSARDKRQRNNLRLHKRGRPLGIVIAHANGPQSIRSWSDITAIDFTPQPKHLKSPGLTGSILFQVETPRQAYRLPVRWAEGRDGGLAPWPRPSPKLLGAGENEPAGSWAGTRAPRR